MLAVFVEQMDHNRVIDLAFSPLLVDSVWGPRILTAGAGDNLEPFVGCPCLCLWYLDKEKHFLTGTEDNQVETLQTLLRPQPGSH